MLGKINPLVAVQVHSQEGDLRGNITIPESVVKFNAVVNANIIGEADMGSVKVTMAVSCFTFPYSFMEQACVALHKIIGVTFDATVLCWSDGNANVFLSLSEVLIGILADNIQFAEGGNLLAFWLRWLPFL